MSSLFIKYGVMAQVGEEPAGTSEVRVFGLQGGFASGRSMWALTFVLDGEDDIVINPDVTASYDENHNIDIGKLTQMTLVISDGHTMGCEYDGDIKLNGTSLLESSISCVSGPAGDPRTFNITEFEFNQDDNDEIEVIAPGGGTPI